MNDRRGRNQSLGTFEDLDCLSSSAGYSAGELPFNKSMGASSRYGRNNRQSDADRMFSPTINANS